jgi:putative membrane protein
MAAFTATSGARRLTRLGIVGLVLVPLLIGGILAWALATPTSQLERVTAAIVNEDEPAQVDGQTVPLGREFAAGLIGGGVGAAAGSSPTFTWVLTNEDEARVGLESGRYVAVVTIPKTFSADALSMSGPASEAHQATIEVKTTPNTAWLDPTLTVAITEGATRALNTQLTVRYLGQVYTGFNTIDGQIGDAADGASQLASGAASTATGAAAVRGGADELAAGLSQLDTGAAELARALQALDTASQGLPSDAQRLAGGAQSVSTAVGAASDRLDEATASFAAIVATICETPGPLCDRASRALQQLQDADAQLDSLAGSASQVADGNAAMARVLSGLVDALNVTASGSADVAQGAASSSGGAAALASGAGQLADGAAQVDSGAAQLAEGLAEAAEQIPTYTDDDITTLSSVVAQPVLTDQDLPANGIQSVPLFAMIALWIGAIVLAIAVQAVPTRRLLTGASSWAIAGRAVGRSAAIGAAQGAVVGVVLLGAVAIDPLRALAFVFGAAAVGAVFAVANQGLAAAFGSVGRILALIIALVALAAGLASTVPPVIAAIASALPTQTAHTILLAALVGDAAAGWLALGGLVFVGAVGVLLVFAGVAARRRTPVSNTGELA